MAELSAKLKNYRIFEVGTTASKGALDAGLKGVGLEDLEPTMTGYIASFKQDANRAEIMNALLTTLGDRLLYLRDISRSTRSLFRNKRDDFPVTMHEADR
jgi:hypothetical protein